MKNILFMCVLNSARSQIAEGLAKNLLSKKLTICSAGSHPTTVNPLTVQVMREINIDISTYYSKNYEDLPKWFRDNLDLVVTLCFDEICPTLPYKTEHLDWPIDDPVKHDKLNNHEALIEFRKTRNQIKEKIKSLKSKIEK